MLILSRKIGELIRIGNGTGAAAIEVIVQRVSGDRVTLGIAAPVHVKILRSELALPDLALAAHMTVNHLAVNHLTTDFSDNFVSEPAAVV
jgi:carbon storage regulator